MQRITEIRKRRQKDTTWRTSRSTLALASGVLGAAPRVGVTRIENVVGRPAKSLACNYQACRSMSRSAVSPASGSDHDTSSSRSTSGSTGSVSFRLTSSSGGMLSCGGGKPAGQEAVPPFQPGVCCGERTQRAWWPRVKHGLERPAIAATPKGGQGFLPAPQAPKFASCLRGKGVSRAQPARSPALAK